MKKKYLNFNSVSTVFSLATFLLTGALNAQVVQTYTYTGTLQTFTVPPCVNTITIEARGAQGGSLTSNGLYSGGLGANMKGVFSVATGNVLNIIVGGMGKPDPSTSGGGGASGVGMGTTPLIVGGGGGGVDYQDPLYSGMNAVTATSGNPGDNSGSAGGTAGSDGGDHVYTSTNISRGGRGWNFNNAGSMGQTGLSASLFTSGTWGLGGGGGSVGYAVCNCGAGGGGYSGGGAGNINTSGGGGGSYNSGTNQVNTAGINTGNGLVILSYFTNGSGVTTSSTGTAVCSGSTAVLTASNVLSYTWSPGGATSQSITVSPTVTTIYTVQGTNSFGCISSATLSVIINSVVPTLTITNSSAASSSAVCAGKTVTLTASGALAYSWTNGVTNGLSYTPTATSDYTVTGINGCGTSTAVTSITVNPLPPVTASINNPTVCTGGSVTLNGGGASSYTWTGNYPNNVAFAPGVTTNYTVTGTGVNGCTNTAVTSVTVFVTPNVAPVASPTAVCVGSSATLSSTGATGYTWTPGTALTTSNIVVSPPSTTTYTLFRVNGACSSTSTITLVINPNPVMSAGATPGTICAGASVSLTAFGAITYNWLPGGFTAANLVLYPNFSTNYVVTGSNGNCTTTMTVPVVVNPSPTISVVSTPSVCSGGSAQLSASGNAATYTWSAGPPNTSAVTVTPAATTIYTITATNASNCTASQNALVVVYQTPSSTLSTSSPYICSAQSATIGTTNASGVSYLWNTGATTSSIVVNPAITTSYTLTATDLSSNCQGSNTITLAVYISTFSLASPTAVCKGSTATFTASGAATSYSWSSNAGGVTTNTVSVSPTVSQVYSVAGITGSCQSVQTISLTVNPIPNVTATKAKSTVCVYDPNTTITAAGATSYSWSTGDLTATAIISPTISTTYTVTGTDLNGCSKTVTVTQFVAACLGIENYAGQSVEMNIYPNPNNGNFTISTDVAMRINIVNTLGEVVKTVDLSTATSNEVSITNLANGIYFITGQSNGLKVNKKIVVRR